MNDWGKDALLKLLQISSDDTKGLQDFIDTYCATASTQEPREPYKPTLYELQRGYTLLQFVGASIIHGGRENWSRVLEAWRAVSNLPDKTAAAERAVMAVDSALCSLRSYDSDGLEFAITTANMRAELVLCDKAFSEISLDEMEKRMKIALKRGYGSNRILAELCLSSGALGVSKLMAGTTSEETKKAIRTIQGRLRTNLADAKSRKIVKT